MESDPFIVIPTAQLGMRGKSPRPGRPSDVYDRYVAFVERAVNVFGSEQGARNWPALDGRIPLEVAEEKSFDLNYFEPIFRKAERAIYC